MIGYISRTGTRRALDAFRSAGLRLMVSARGALRAEGFRYALDNGAWTASQEHRAGKRPTADPDLRAFVRAVDAMGAGADFIVVPDVVEGGARSLAMSRAWLRKLRRRRDLRGVVLLLAVQDGFEEADVERFLSPRVGIFVGGSTDWKLATLGRWAQLANRRGAHCHCGRVNTGRRVKACDVAGVHSFDGSGPALFLDCLPPILEALEQPDLEGWLSRNPALAA